jgi:PAS domain S-box-containing protein
MYLDDTMKVTKINYSAEQILGIDKEHLEGRKVTKLNWSSFELDGESYKLNDLPFNRAIKYGEVCVQEIMGVYNPRKKELVWLQVDAKPVFKNNKKNPTEVFVTFTDITNNINYQREIKRAKELLEKTGETALVASYEYLIQENKLTWSDVAYKIHEIPHDFKLDLTSAISFYSEGESRKAITSAVADAIVKGESFDVTCEIITAKGNRKWLRSIGIPERKNGVTISIYGTAQDITRLVQQSATIKSEQERLAAIVSHAEIGTWEWDTEQQEMIINDYFASMLGYSKEELVPISGNKMRELTHHEDLPMVTKLFHECSTGQIQAMENEVRLKHKNGHWVWVLNKANVVSKSEDGKSLRMFGVHIDLSGVKKAEDNLRLSEQRFKLIADNVNEIFWLRNADNTAVYYVNPAYERVYGYSTESLIKRPESFIDAIYKEDLHLFYDAYEAYNVTGNFDVDFRIVRSDGEIRWLNSKSIPVYDEHGKVVFHTGIATDITRQKQIETELRASELRFRKLFTENASPMLLINPFTGQVVDANPASEQFYGWKKEEFLRKFAHQLCYFEDGIMPTSPWWMDTTRKYTTLNHKLADGVVKALEVYYSTIEMNKEQLVFAIIHDVSEKKAYLEAIEQQNAVLKDIAWTQSHMVRSPLSNIMGLMNLLSLERNVQANPNGFTISSEVYEALVKSAMQMDKALREVSQKTNIVDELKSRLN